MTQFVREGEQLEQVSSEKSSCEPGEYGEDFIHGSWSQSRYDWPGSNLGPTPSNPLEESLGNCQHGIFVMANIQTEFYASILIQNFAKMQTSSEVSNC